MSIVKFDKTKHRRLNARALPLAQLTDAGRFFNKMVRDIEVDLGGRRQLTRIELELISGFAGAATTLRYLNAQVALGDTGAIDLSGYATIASTMLRIGSKLGLQRRGRDVTPDFYEDVLPRIEAAQREKQSAQETLSQEIDDEAAS